MGSGLGLLAVLLLVLGNGFFVATEFAIVAVRRSRLQQLATEGRTGAADATEVVTHLDAYIAACQFGITLTSLALGWLGEPALAHLIEPPLTALVGGFAPAASHGVAVAIAFAVITALHIVVGELAPKGLALQRAEATALAVARPMRVFYTVFRLPISLLNAVGNGVLRLAGLEPAGGHEMIHTVEEVRLLVRGMEQAGVVEASEARIASRAFQFADQVAGALMTPRTELEAVPADIAWDALLARAADSRHSKLLVFERTLDDVVGFVRARDVLRAGLRGGPADLAALVRPPLVVPESKPADELLEELRLARQHLALVVDEYGGTAGVVTVEDLAGALVGRFEDDPHAAMAQPDTGVQPDGSVLLEGRTRLSEFEELSGARPEAWLRDEVETLGGLVMALLRRVPQEGDEVEVGGRALRVERMDGRRIGLVRLLPVEQRAG